MDLLVFTVDPSVARAVGQVDGVGVIVDWERRGKARRQAGEGTQINGDTPADLAAVRAATDARVVCRVNGPGRWTRAEVELAVALGADEVLVPMVRRAGDVHEALEAAAGRCGVGVLVETRDAVASAAQIANLPLSRVYVGLNDLRIDRGSTDLFAPLVDGTVDAVRAATGTVPFGVGGLTLPDRGAPVPSRLLAGELARLDASFTFLRRSFHADAAGRDVADCARLVREHAESMRTRSAQDVETDRADLTGLLVPRAVPA